MIDFAEAKRLLFMTEDWLWVEIVGERGAGDPHRYRHPASCDCVLCDAFYALLRARYTLQRPGWDGPGTWVETREEEAREKED